MTVNFRQHLARRLLELRGDTPLAVAARGIGISRQQLHTYETAGKKANPTLANLLAIASYYGCHSLEELFGPMPSSDAIPRRQA